MKHSALLARWNPQTSIRRPSVIARLRRVLRLHVVPAQGDSFDQTLEEEEVVIGRSSQCQVTIADRFLSRRHARLFRRESRWWIEDLGSRNGTLVNGRVIEGSEPVDEGDEIQISGSLLQVLAESPSSAIVTTDRGLPGHTVFRPASDLLPWPP